MQLVTFHSLDRPCHELVLDGGRAELVQLAWAVLVQLQLGVGAQVRECGGHHVGKAELVQLAGAQLAQQQLGVGAQVHECGGGHRVGEAELVQLAGAQLAQLQLGVKAQCVGGCHQQLLQLKLAQLGQLLDVQAHLGGVGGGGQCHLFLHFQQ